MRKLSSIQKGICLTQNIHPLSPIFNVGGYAFIDGSVDEIILKKSIYEIIDKCDVVEIGYFAINSSTPSARRFKKCDFAVIDFSERTNKDEIALRWMKDDMKTLLDPKSTLLIVRLIKISTNRHYLYLKAHRLIFDGYSMSLFFNYISQVYASFLDGSPMKKIKLGSFNNFINEEYKYRASNEYKIDKKFWTESIKNALGTRMFNSSLKSDTISSLSSRRKELKIPRELYDQISSFCTTNHFTIFHYFLSTLAILNYCYNNNGNFIIGLPVFNRTSGDYKKTLGPFANVLAYPFSLNKTWSFMDTLRETKGRLRQCYKHIRFPLNDLLDEIEVQGNVYNVVFSYQRNVYNPNLGDAPVSINYIHNYAQQEDLVIHLAEYSNVCAPSLFIDYKVDSFTEHIINNLIRHYYSLLSKLLLRPITPLPQLDFLSDKEKQTLLEKFNTTEVSYSSNKTMVQMFEEQVERMPEKTALIFKNESFSFSDLNKMANRLAQYLRINYSIQPDDLIGIKLERSEKMIISLLGVLKSGAAYLPIDPQFPQERIDYIVRNSQCKLVIDINELEKFNSEEGGYSDRNLQLLNKATDLAYVIYTSGSTGDPKGCMLEHKGIVNRIEWMWTRYQFSERDIILQKTTFTFDVSVCEFFTPLCKGATMVLCQKDDIASPHRILNLVRTHRITYLHFVPSMLSEFISVLSSERVGFDLGSVRHVMASGEALPAETVKKWYKVTEIPLHNLYGPTEASVDITWFDTSENDIIVPIGRPISNTKIYILSEDLSLLPIGTIGEICVGGVALARGYINNPLLTKEKFISNPFLKGEKVYKTGDLGRWLPNGNIEYIGRKDGQIKIRGYRIELGEIENALQRYNDINSTVVVVHSSREGEKELIAYFVAKKKLNVHKIKEHLERILPVYMIPLYFIQLKVLPLTSHGKVDKKKLPSLSSANLITWVDYVAPRNGVEEKLVVIWQNILEKERIGIKDHFFELGGQSLKAMRLVNQLFNSFDVRLEIKDIFVSPVLEEQAQLILKTKRSVYKAIQSTIFQSSYPLSPSQYRLWILSHFDKGSIAYNIPSAFFLDGYLNLAVFKMCFIKMMARHESLRTFFREDKQGRVRQYIISLNDIAFHYAYWDLRERDEKHKLAKTLVEEEFVKPFELSQLPLFRVGLIHLEKNKWILTFVIHHIISDGWSMSILFKELISCYNRLIAEKEYSLQPLRIQYKDYVAWQVSQKKASIKIHKDYWLKQLKDDLPILEMPVDRPRPQIKTYNGKKLQYLIDGHLSQGLKSLCFEENSSLFMGLLALLSTLLYRYTYQDDIIVGNPIAGREHIDLDNQVGFFVNTLALRVKFNKDGDFIELINKCKQIVLEAYQHQSYSFDDLINELKLQRDMSRNALFDVMVVLQNTGDYNPEKERLGSATLKTYEAETFVSKFDLSFEFIEVDDGLKMNIEYNTDIYDKSTIERMADHLNNLLKAIIKSPITPINKIDFISPAEKQIIVTRFNNTERKYPKKKSIINLFEKQVHQTPQKTALIFGNTILTYEELNKRADQLANYLKKNYQIESGQLIAIVLERSDWFITAILAIIKSGCGYIPIDPNYPQQRIDYILKNSRCKLVINDVVLDVFKNHDSKEYNENRLSPGENPDDILCIIYTSGSTGQPKGCVIGNKGVVNHLYNKISLLNLSADDSICHSSELYFVGGIWQLWAPLITGGKVILSNKEELKDINELLRVAKTHGAKVLEVIPSQLNEYLYMNGKIKLNDIKRLILTGEKLNMHFVKKCYAGNEQLEIINTYGQTECSDVTTTYKIPRDFCKNEILIGRPIQNTQIYIYSPDEMLCPIGIIGEIYIAGDCLSFGYLNQPELNKQKFIPHPFKKGHKIFKSGDLGRWLPDGNIEIFGRKDDQIKIRGHRVEIAEVQKVLLQYEGVDEVVLDFHQHNQKDNILVAYIVSKNNLNVTDIREFLSEKLPTYMLPSKYIQIEQIPLLQNGKIDKKKMLTFQTELQVSTNYTPPSNEIEISLEKIWKTILQKRRVGINDNFFELGGQSLLAVSLINEIQQVFDIKLNVKQVFENATIKKLAREINKELWLRNSMHLDAREDDFRDVIKL